MQLTTEETKRIDIRWLKKNGQIGFNHFGTLSWNINGEPSGIIGYQMTKENMMLSYKISEISYRYNVPISETACNFGGFRKWLHCPTCDRRVCVLYLRASRFKCRQCAQLPYRSTLQTDIDRLIDQKHKLGYEIFEGYDGIGWRRRKGMHRKKFDRKRDRYIDLECAIDEYIHTYLIRHPICAE